MTNPSTSRCRGKVATLIETHDLQALGADLEARWTSEGDDRHSLRDLAEYVNRRLLTRAIQRADASTLDEDVAGVYRRLTGDDVSTGSRVQTRRRLERAGVDIDRLEDDFVSRQAVHTYLTECRGANYDPDDGDSLATETEHIERLVQRTATVTESKLERLHRDGELPIEEFSVFVDVHVLCEECGTQHPVGTLLDGDACDCAETTD